MVGRKWNKPRTGKRFTQKIVIYLNHQLKMVCYKPFYFFVYFPVCFFDLNKITNLILNCGEKLKYQSILL